MSVAKAIVKRPVLWLVVFALVSISGIFMISNIAVERFPEMQAPYLVVSTTYPGADPETVEKSVTNVLEAAIANTGRIQKMTSTSRSQSSLIMLQFDFGANIDVKINRVRESIDRVKSALPENAASPLIMQLRADDQPIMRIAVRGNAGGGLSQNDLRFIAKNELEDQFKQIEGVSSVSVGGGQDSIVRVSLSQNRLEAYGITINEIARSLTAQNRELGAGFIEEGLIEYSIKTSGEFSSLAEIANTVVLQIGGADIRLQDIGDVSFDFQEERSTVYVNGVPGVYISIIKQSGANTVMVADQIYKRFDDLKKTLPKEINLEITSDGTLQTRAMLNELVNSAITGVILAMLVVILFLRNINGSIIIGLAIPLSFLITLLGMALSNITINMMTLAGLILGLGMTVDCSIVILESITAYREKGEKPTLAAILAGEEVMSSLIASTITTVSVFIPFILFKNKLEIVGIMIQDLVFTICVSVAASLFIGIFLVPVLASKWLPVHSRLQKPLRNPFIKKIDDGISNGIKALTKGYQWLLSKALKHRLITVFLVVCLFLGSAFAMTRLDMTIIPNETDDTVTLNIEMPLGRKYDDTKAVALEMQEFAIAEINGIKNIMTNVGSSGMALGGAGVNTASITIVLDLDASNADSDESTKDKLRSHFADFPDAIFSFSSFDLSQIMGEKILTL
jgi:hydrophobic/amphiphilic exporter-1 (mainly G- bacteria), HAE1 family